MRPADEILGRGEELGIDGFRASGQRPGVLDIAAGIAVDPPRGPNFALNSGSCG
jgi:hypothetical protein